MEELLKEILKELKKNTAAIEEVVELFKKYEDAEIILDERKREG